MGPVTVIREHPDAGAVVEPPIRHFPMDVYPYDVVYAPEPDVIFILAIAHHRREPGYWRGRR